MTRDEFKDLVGKMARKLYGQAFRLLRDREEAEDAVQEVFMKLWKMKDNLGNYDNIEALASTITRNYCIDRIRRGKIRTIESYNADNHYVADQETPYEVVVNKESSGILRSIIGGLKENVRAIFVMKELEGLSYEEIAEKTGNSVNNLRVILARARGTLRDEYNKYNNERGRT